MRVDHRCRKARLSALGANDGPSGDLAGERDHLLNGTNLNGLQALLPHHADFSGCRRRKTEQELLAGLEFIELAERRRRP